jgi:hypothetical protein
MLLGKLNRKRRGKFKRPRKHSRQIKRRGSRSRRSRSNKPNERKQSPSNRGSRITGPTVRGGGMPSEGSSRTAWHLEQGSGGSSFRRSPRKNSPRESSSYRVLRSSSISICSAVSSVARRTRTTERILAPTRQEVCKRSSCPSTPQFGT